MNKPIKKFIYIPNTYDLITLGEGNFIRHYTLKNYNIPNAYNTRLINSYSGKLFIKILFIKIYLLININ